ncbi:MAG: efflux RND transporter periplasmic adaptor subunit [Gemmatimonadetes bacterium]|nr:efflux RND transporter periplasmic adaptor subunit [Gemmatimonadota bacterium]
MTKKLLLTAAVLAAGAILVVLSVEPADERARVETRTVTPRDFVATVDASGVVRPGESVDISAEVVGRLLEVTVRPGDPVEPGQIVARIDDATQRPIVEEQRAVVREAETALTGAEIEEEDAEREHTRARELHEQGVVSARRVEETRVALDRAANGRERANQNIERARSALRRAEEDLRRTVVRSPMHGTVLSVDLEPGELVVASSQNLPGSKIMTLGTDDELLVEANVPEVDVVEVQEGQPAEVTLTALGETVLAGEVVEIQRVGQRDETARFGGAAPGAEFLARIRLLDPPAAVRPSMSAQVRIETDRRADALAVPIGALLRRFPEGADQLRSFAISMGGDGTDVSGRTAPRAGGNEEGEEPAGGWQVAFVVQDDRIEERRVETGLSDLLEVEITAGLATDEVVVVGPALVLRTLEDGDEVVGLEGDGGARR